MIVKLEKIKLPPISFMNLDSKFPNKILADQFIPCRKRIIYPHNVGFIQAIQDWFNIGKSIIAFLYEQKKREKNMFISKDATKTFGK